MSGDGVVDEAFAEAPSQAKRTSKERVRKVDTDGKCALLNLKVRPPQGGEKAMHVPLVGVK